MMPVHFFPYANNYSIINGGSLNTLGVIWIDLLGRASVATLSLISGYLLCRSFYTSDFVTIVRKRSQALLVPMLTWNLIFILAALSLALVGVRSDVVPSLSAPVRLISSITGLFGPTANLSLFFIRDLFVCSVILAALWGVIGRAPYVALALAAVLAVLDMLEPVVFRPTILVFMLAGCILRKDGIRLERVAAPRIAVPTLLICAILLAGVRIGDPALPQRISTDLQNLLLRASLIAAVLMLASYCVRRGLHKPITAYAPSAFLAYLSHVLIAKFFWELSDALGADVDNYGYVAYFILMPFVVFWIARLSLPLIRRLPGILPQLLTGKPGAQGPGKAEGPATWPG